jgi:hypothetical protein
VCGYLHFEQGGPIVLLTIYAQDPRGASVDDSSGPGGSFATSGPLDVAKPLQDLEADELPKPARRSWLARFGAWFRPLTLYCSAKS